MSTEIVTNVFHHSKLKSTKRLLLVVMADQANSFGVSYPGVGTLASFANVTSRRVTDHIRGIEEAGEVYTHHREGQHNVYIVLPGLTEAQRAQAVQFINSAFPIIKNKETGEIEPLTLDDLPPMVPTGVTPDSSGTPVDSDTPDSSDRGKATEPLTDPSAPPDSSVRRSKDSVVVGNEESDISDIQQQSPPPPRDPEPIERGLFAEHHIQEAIWRSWMDHDSVTVVAAILHAALSPDVANPVGLMRAMLEQGTASPASRFVSAAKEKLDRTGSGSYTPEQIEILEANNWDTRALLPSWNGNGHRGAK